MTDLSKTMREALTYAAYHGGLQRLPSGFWCKPDESQWHVNPMPVSFGTPTVQALVSRGLAEYTEWKDGRNGRFPIRMAVKKEPTIG